MKELLTVQEVLDQEPDTWVEPGFRAIVKTIRKGGAKKPVWEVTLQDEHVPAVISCSMFSPPPFEVGDVVEFEGKGIKRKEYQGKAEVGVRGETEITVAGRVENTPPARMQRGAAADPRANSSALPPAEMPWLPAGPSVGQAIKLAFDSVSVAQRDLNDPKFWRDVHQVASDVLRVHKLLEAGTLAPSAKARAAGPAAAAAPPPIAPALAPRVPAQIDDDVPF